MRTKPYTPSVRSTLRTFGHNIHIARRKRRQSQQEFANRMGISLGTLKRLEKGEPGISIGTVAMAFLALGESERLSNVLDMTTDDTGLLLEQKNLPKRIRKPRPPEISGPDQVTTLYPDGMVF